MSKFILKAIGLAIVLLVITYCKRNPVQEPKATPSVPIPQKVAGPLEPEPESVFVTPKRRIKGKFHGNQKTRVFHGPGCPAYNCPNCIVGLRSKRQAKREGFKPHSCVKPKKHKRKKTKVNRGPP